MWTVIGCNDAVILQPGKRGIADEDDETMAVAPPGLSERVGERPFVSQGVDQPHEVFHRILWAHLLQVVNDVRQPFEEEPLTGPAFEEPPQEEQGLTHRALVPTSGFSFKVSSRMVLRGTP